jgi:hypothetical protein
MRFESLSSAKPAEHIRSEIIDSKAAARDPPFNRETAFLSEKIALLCHRKAPVSAQQLRAYPIRASAACNRAAS